MSLKSTLRGCTQHRVGVQPTQAFPAARPRGWDQRQGAACPLHVRAGYGWTAGGPGRRTPVRGGGAGAAEDRPLGAWGTGAERLLELALARGPPRCHLSGLQPARRTPDTKHRVHVCRHVSGDPSPSVPLLHASADHGHHPAPGSPRPQRHLEPRARRGQGQLQNPSSGGLATGWSRPGSTGGAGARVHSRALISPWDPKAQGWG